MFDCHIFHNRSHGELEWNGKTLVIMQSPYPFLDNQYKAWATDADENSDQDYMIYWDVIDKESQEDPCDWEKFKVEVI
jgi:hypothetical protein